VPADSRYDAVIVVSFGGPEGPDDVMPFLQRVLQGRAVPPERLREVAGHYHRFGGVSPINAHNRALVEALNKELRGAGLDLPVYWGNRNWHPLLADEVRRMAGDGVRRALAFVTSAYASYSGCRRYLEDLDRARQEVGPTAPEIHKLRLFYDHPGFVRANAGSLRHSLYEAGGTPHVAFTAHSIPLDMAATSAYVQQLSRTARLVAAEVAPGGTACPGSSSTRAGAAGPASRGSSRTSTITCGPWPAQGSMPRWSPRSASPPITWRWCTTSTWRPGPPPTTPASGSSGPPPPACRPTSSP
jgi:hypothetical protein